MLHYRYVFCIILSYDVKRTFWLLTVSGRLRQVGNPFCLSHTSKQINRRIALAVHRAAERA